MKLASICIIKAKRKHNIMGSQLGAKCESLTANAPPIITGTAAPVRVFGLEANIHARKEFVFIVSAILIIVSQRYLRPLRLTKK